MPDMHNLLVKLIDDVGDMGYGDPYNNTAPRILAADVIRWAVAEIERHRMTEEERRMATSAADFMSHPGIDPEPLAWLAEVNGLRGYLARTAQKELRRWGVNDDRDIVDRLSDLCGDVGRWAGETISKAMDEITRLRIAIRRLAEQDATLSVCDGNVTVTMDAPGESQDSAAMPLRAEIARLAAQVERHRMTEDEREVLEQVWPDYAANNDDAACANVEFILQRYLDRTKPKEPFNG